MLSHTASDFIVTTDLGRQLYRKEPRFREATSVVQGHTASGCWEWRAHRSAWSYSSWGDFLGMFPHQKLQEEPTHLSVKELPMKERGQVTVS